MSKNILLLGEFSTGKSAFLNMLLGVQLLPEQLDSTNLPVVKIQAGKPGGIWLREPGQKNPRAIESWSDIPEDWNEFDHAEVTVSGHPYLDRGLVFWDTPGINTTNSHHKQHLDKFLKSKGSDFLSVLFFVSGNLTSTSIDFLKQNRSLWDKMTIIVNIKEVMGERQSRQIGTEVKKTVRTQLGNLPVELLYIGDACEDFNEVSEKNREGLTDYELMWKWSTVKVDLLDLLQRHEDDLIGADVFDIVLSYADMPEPESDDNIIDKRADIAEPKVSSTKEKSTTMNRPNSSEMVFIEGGTFEMGSIQGRADEKPVHRVKVKSFYMGSIPVTNIEYNNTIPRKRPKPSNLNPVVNVHWKDALKYCNELSRMEGLEISYKFPRNADPSWDPKANGYRLPTEAEWEFAARGGNKSQGLKYSGSNDLDQVAWYGDNSNGSLHPLGEKEPNELGLLDMSGNVCEWCWDYYDKNSYSQAKLENPKGPTGGLLWFKVVRGGSYLNMEHQCSVSVRSRFNGNRHRVDVGFRCVRNA